MIRVKIKFLFLELEFEISEKSIKKAIKKVTGFFKRSM